MRNYVIGTSDHTGRHLNMVQAENVQAALEMCGVLDMGKIPRKDMASHADVDYIYVEEQASAVVDPDKKEFNELAGDEIRTVGDLKAILANIPDTYAVTLGSDSVAVPDGRVRVGTTYDHGAYEVNSFLSHIRYLHVNPDRRELYVGVDITLNKLRV